MDKANAALSEYLIEEGRLLYLVAHHVEPELSNRPAVTVRLAPKTFNSFLTGEWSLNRRGRSIAQAVTARWPRARVLVNGGNCNWPDINWVHYVHRAWRPCDHDAPLPFRLKNRFAHAVFQHHEVAALRHARIVIANSEATKTNLVECLGLRPESIHTVYLGVDQTLRLTTPVRRNAARRWLRQPDNRPLIAFVGALDYDSRKGFDCLWRAWLSLCASARWDADLLVAGGGRRLADWRNRVTGEGLENSVALLGFTERVADVLAAADLLVSPVRYESYGLNVQEALCCGVPAMVSAHAGVAEQYPSDLHELLIPNPEDTDDLAARLFRWRSSIDYWKERVVPFAQKLRTHTWQDMAREIVSLVETS